MEDIFHMRCNVGGKHCSPIINRGCTNVASKAMVEKLKFSASPHLSPYTNQWLKQGKGIHVSCCCLVSLSIGKNYKDDIWCEVFLMDACHVVLSRPWSFDRRIMHDGLMNTYSFVLDHKKITFLHLDHPNSSS